MSRPRSENSMLTVAEEMGVTYAHLFRVVRGDRESDPLLLTVWKKHRHLIEDLAEPFKEAAMRRIKKIKPLMKWSRVKGRYVWKDLTKHTR